jgi:CheY-like chemotaxis protein
MSYGTRQTVMLLAEDDPADRRLLAKALQRSGFEDKLYWVEDGQELLDYLRGKGEYSANGKPRPRPSIILLDLNMPRKGGSEALAEIKSDPKLCDIPIVVLTTSDDEADIERSYRAGCNAFITKPNSLDALVKIVQVLHDHWFQTVKLPERPTELNLM